jgi:glycosyltransferase involved in cell wall biosynthesis
MLNGKRIAVVMPAYNAAKTLEITVAEVPDLVDIRILVDDYSRDEPVEVAHRLGVLVYRHDRNYGYGRNQQTCYREALAAGADVVIMLHPDYQYTPLLITAMASMVALGSRIIGGRALHGGMPLYKYVSNRLLTAFENLFLGVKLGVPHRISRVQPEGAHGIAVAGELRRLCFRQSDARAMRLFRIPYRRSFLSHEIFRGGFVY